MDKIIVKPLSVNQCWKGRRFKTQQYEDYEQVVLLLLPRKEISNTNKLQIKIEVGFSNKNSDLDNCLKPFLDILQTKYRFNDKQIYKIEIEKKIVEKKKEYISFEISDYK